MGLFSLVRTHKSSGELERAGKCNQILQIVRLFTTIGSKRRSCRSLQDSRISLMTLGRNLKTTTKRRAQSSAKRLILGKTLDQAQEFFLYWPGSGVCRRQQGAARLYHIREFKHGLTVPRIRDCRACRGYAQYPSKAGTTGPCVKEPPLKAESQLENIQRETDDQNEFAQDGPHAQVPRG